jgi:hypothetical protein
MTFKVSNLETQSINQEVEDSLKLLRSVAKTDKEGNLIVNPDEYQNVLRQHLIKQLEDNPCASNDLVSKYWHRDRKHPNVLTRS